MSSTLLMLRQLDPIPSSGAEKSEPSLAKGAALVLGALFAAAAFLHVYGIGDKALWYDEVTTALYGSMPVARLWDILANEDFHPPLYFLLQRPFLALPLPVEWQLRLMPLLSSAAAAVLAELIARRMGGLRWVGAVLGAFFPGLLIYAQEARVYATLTALEFAAFYGVLRTREAPEQLRWPFVTLGALWLAAAMHYLSVLFIVPLGIAVLYFTRRRVAAPLVALGFAALYLPWLPHVYHGFFSRTSPIAHVAPRHVDLTAIWNVFTPHWGGDAWGAAVAVAAVIVLGCSARKARAEALLLAALAVFPWLFFQALLPKYPFFHPRYFLPWAALPLLILPLAGKAPQRFLKIALIALMAVLVPAFAYQGYAHDSAPRTWNRELAAMSQELFEEGDLIIIEPYYQSIALFYYMPLTPNTRANVLQDPMKVYPGVFVDPDGVLVAAASVDYTAKMVGNAPLSGRAYVLEYGPKSPAFQGWEGDLVVVKQWPQATLYRLNKRIWADPDYRAVFIGRRPIAPWAPATLEKQF